MVSKKVVISSEKGMHLRMASMFCEEALKYSCHIDVKCGSKCLNGKSVLGVLGAGIHCGDEMEILCDGEEEEKALSALLEIVHTKINQE